MMLLKGYTVELVGRGAVRYEERGRHVVVPGEMLVGDHEYDFAIYAKRECYWKHDVVQQTELVSDADWKLIQARIEKWFHGRVEWNWQE